MAAPPDDSPDRRGELAGRLAQLRARLAEACASVGRDAGEVTLVAVTKTYPASDVALLARLGVTDIGESRDQEAKVKVGEVDDPAVRWHFVGRLQTNKCRSVASYATAVHSVDRPDVVAALARGAARAEREVGVFVQVSLDDDPARGGAPAAAVPRVADAVAAASGLALLGVMAVAPLGAAVDAAFARLGEVSAELRRDHPAASAISAGMSGDYQAAVRHGATHVRIGSALLGRRNPVFG